MLVKHPDPSESSLLYCADLLKSGDEDLWLTAQFAAEADRPRLFARFALHHEIARIPAAVSEPPLGEIRLQWWREAIAEIVGGETPRAHPVVAALAATGVDAADAASLGAMIDARARLLYDETFRDIEDLAAWLGETDGALARWNTGIDAAGEAGALYGLARYGAALAPSLAGRIPAYASRLKAVAAPRLADLSPRAASAILYVALAGRYLKRAGPPSPLSKRLRLFCAAATGKVLR